MDNNLEEMKYQLEKAMRRECKLDFRLAEVWFYFIEYCDSFQIVESIFLRNLSEI